MTPTRIHVCSLLLILGTASGNAAATVPCFGGDEPYTAATLPDTDLETGLPCRLPTAEELARRAEAWGLPVDAGAAAGSAGAAAYPPPQAPAAAAPSSGWSGQSMAPANGANGGYGSAGGGYGGGYGGGQGGGGVQGGSFKGRGQPQGGGVGNPYSSGKTFTRPPRPLDPSAFGGGTGDYPPPPSPY